VAVLGKGMLLSVSAAPKAGVVAAATHLGVTIYSIKDLTEQGFIRTETLNQGLVISPDGKLLAGTKLPPSDKQQSTTTIHVWNVQAQVEMLSIEIEVPPSRDLVQSFSPDGQFLVVATGAGPAEIRLYAVANGTLACKLTGHESAIKAIAYAPDGTRLYTAAVDQTLRAWDLHQCAPDWAITTDHPLAGLELSEDGKLLTETDEKGSIWDAYTGEVRGQRDGSATFTWQADPDYRGRIESLGIYSGSVRNLNLSPDGALIAAVGGGKVNVWDTRTGQLRFTIPSSSPPRFGIFSADGLHLLVGTDESHLDIYSCIDGALLETVARDAPTEVGAVSPDGSYVAVGSAEKGVDLYQTGSNTPLLNMSSSQNINQLAFSPDGKLLAGGLSTGQIRIWSLLDGKLRTTLYQDQDAIRMLAYSQDGKHLFSKANRNKPRIWDAVSGQLLQSLEGKSYGGIILGVGISPSEQLMALSQYIFHQEDRAYHFHNLVIDIGSRAILSDFPLGGDGANAVIFSPDGARIFASGGYGVIYVYAVPQ